MLSVTVNSVVSNGDIIDLKVNSDGDETGDGKGFLISSQSRER